MTEYKTESFMEDKVSHDFGNRWMDRQMNRWKDRWTQRQKDTHRNGSMDRYSVHRQMDGQHIEEVPL